VRGSAAVGEPASADKFTLAMTRRTHPAIDGVQRFIAAMQQDDADRAWLQLSAETRKVLQVRAVAAGVRGVDLLRARKLPVDNSMTGAMPFDPVAMFAVAGVKSLQLATTPAREDVVEQRVNLIATSGATQTIVMRFEGYHWRIHKPDLKLP
jgi:hypothetical protein